MISFNITGSFDHIDAFLTKMPKLDILGILASSGPEGVAALQAVTPVRTGLAAGAWGYDVNANNGKFTIYWTNTDVNKSFPVAIMLQYGHGTRNGGYVQGRDYINPAIKPIADDITAKVWKAVTSA